MKIKYFRRKESGFIYIAVNGYRVSTKIKIDENKWDKGYVNRRQTVLINKLQTIEKRILKMDVNLLSNANLKLVIANKTINSTSIKDHINRWLESVLNNGFDNSITDGTYANYNYIINKLADVIDLDKDIRNLNKEFVLKLMNYYTTISKLSISTRKIHITVLKMFFNFVELENDDMKINSYIKIKFNKSNTENIALNKNEIEALKQIKLSPKLNLTRNLYLLGAMTGQRKSDLRSIIDQYKKDEKLLEVIQKKTSKRVYIPIQEGLEELTNSLKAYNTMNRNVDNDNLKVIFKMLNFNRIIIKNNKQVKLKDVATFHSSRKTFITRALNNGVPASTVMFISGHTCSKNFSKYIGTDKDDLLKFKVNLAL